MKVIAIINISNPDDLMCDSGVIFQRILAEEFQILGIDYAILGPNVDSFKNLHFEGARKLYASLGTSRYSSRFTFDWESIQEIIKSENPDVIFNSQVEITSALRSLLVTINNSKAKLVTYCHYPSIWSVQKGIPEIDKSLDHKKLGTPVVFNIISALHTADIFVIQSEFAKSLLNETANYFNIGSYNDIQIIPPPTDPILNESIHKAPPKNRNLLYNHRLYQSYGTDEFLDFLSHVKHLNVDLIVSDPMPSRSKLRESLSVSPSFYRSEIEKLTNAKVINGNVERQIYKKIIQDVRVSFASFRKACVWSMSAIDCMSLGIPVLAPNYAAYPEFIPQQLLFSDTKQAIYLLDKLMSDDEFWQQSSISCKKITESLAPHEIANRFYALFQQ